MHPHPTFKVRCRAVILHEGKLFVVKHRPDADYYALPGGHMDPGEKPDECLVREIIEELGVAPMVGRLLYIHTFHDKDGIDSVEFFFEVKNGADFINLEGNERTHAYELSEVRWISSEEKVNLLPRIVEEDFAQGKILSDSTRFTRD